MCDEKVLNYFEETCKGGMRRKYSTRLNEDEFKKYIAMTAIESMYKDFPNQTIEALKESLGKKLLKWAFSTCTQKRMMLISCYYIDIFEGNFRSYHII